MGSFNTSCFVSQQTITPGNNCVLLPIVKNSSYEPVELVNDGGEILKEHGVATTTCYPTAFWRYAGPIFNVTYNDRGTFKIDNTDENMESLRIFFNVLEDSLFEVREGNNKCHDLPLNFKNIYNSKQKYSFEELCDIWEKMWDVGQEFRLFMRNNRGGASQLQFAVMHKHTSDYLIEVVEGFKDYDEKSCEIKEYLSKYIQNELPSIKIDDKKILSQDEKENLRFKAFSFFANVSSLTGYDIGRQEGSHYHFYQTEKIYKLKDKYCIDGCIEMSDELLNDIFEIHKTQINHRYIARGLAHLNIRLAPMVYTSQDYSNDIGKQFVKMVKTVGQKVSGDIKSKRKLKY